MPIIQYWKLLLEMLNDPLGYPCGVVNELFPALPLKCWNPSPGNHWKQEEGLVSLLRSDKPESDAYQCQQKQQEMVTFLHWVPKSCSAPSLTSLKSSSIKRTSHSEMYISHSLTEHLVWLGCPASDQHPCSHQKHAAGGDDVIHRCPFTC